ncbi:flagellar motor protein MotB [Pokkaliibacter plantistimulans]|uniref:Flagellar motor protein MotB n=1 Tax=Pokkaliibacter plantistimulans TaxID=1635171 RepID=A0ABX5M3N6_9GAMM|nr:flagellar motor protein MotB [Pokkaliibacter plantistimulans]PXF32999.1 flagellar motor protein MotB [Pokkaliibacter plantistimulans]
MSDDVEECKCKPGLPAWLATFADLMSLMMCFFVLLLSFSEMDVLKYKQIAGSMRAAFGVQNQLQVKDIPKGTSIIAQEFSPGRPEPTPLNEVRQFTTDQTRSTLDVQCAPGRVVNPPEEQNEENKPQASAQQDSQQQSQEDREAQQQTEETAINVASALNAEIAKGSIEVETQEQKIIIRVKEQGSFESGSAAMNYAFVPIMAKIRDVLLGVRGRISIEGHTDNVPIHTAQFQSNWALSTARALSVAEELFADGRLDQRRFSVVGYADTHPLAPNNTSANRAANRRVEIVIHQGKDLQSDEPLVTPPPTTNEAVPLAPQEIF